MLHSPNTPLAFLCGALVSAATFSVVFGAWMIRGELTATGAHARLSHSSDRLPTSAGSAVPLLRTSAELSDQATASTAPKPVHRRPSVRRPVLVSPTTASAAPRLRNLSTGAPPTNNRGAFKPKRSLRDESHEISLYELDDDQKNEIWWEIARASYRSGEYAQEYTINTESAEPIARKYGVSIKQIFDFFRIGVDADWRSWQDPAVKRTANPGSEAEL